MKYKIRKAKFEDSKNIAKVHIQSWHETYKGVVDDEYLKSLVLGPRTKKWQEKLKTPKGDSWTFVAENANGKIVGFVFGGIAHERIAQYKGEIYAIYILKKDQRNKLGYQLTKKLCSMLSRHGIKNMYVGVLRDNPSKSFYVKHGAHLFKAKKLKIGKKRLTVEYYGWVNFGKFFK